MGLNAVISFGFGDFRTDGVLRIILKKKFMQLAVKMRILRHPDYGRSEGAENLCFFEGTKFGPRFFRDSSDAVQFFC
jgi:hypothetical protein